MLKKFQGVYAVPCTPFDNQGDVDEAAIRRHLRFLLDEGKVKGMIPVGSTGEFAFQTEEECKRVIEVTLDEVNKKVPVIAGAAACSTRQTIANAQFAQKAGADGVMVVSPFYGHINQEELYAHFSTLAKNVDLPIIIYNNPGASGSDILPETLARLADFDNLVAVKESTGVMQRVAEIQRLCGDKLEVLCGCDTLVYEMFIMGVEGWIAAPANVIPRECMQLYELAVVKKDLPKARAYYDKIAPVLNLFESSGQYMQLAKAGLKMLNHGIGDPRLPLLPPTKELQDQLKGLLDALCAN
jgi:4-hydroxy-tetrahydrodipicolinate synthase